MAAPTSTVGCHLAAKGLPARLISCNPSPQCHSRLEGHMLQTEVLRPWMRLSFETFRLGLQVQSSMIGLFKNGRALMTPSAAAPEAPSPLASALGGTPYAREVVQAVTDEIASESRAAKPRAARVKSGSSSRRATQGGANKVAKRAAKKPSARKGPARRKG